MLRTGLLAMISMGAIVFAQSEGGKNCCDKCGDSAGKEMACCAKAELSKDEIKARLKAANRDLKLSDAKIDKIADAIGSSGGAKHGCCDKMKTAESGSCCE